MPVIGAFVWAIILSIGRMLVWVWLRWGGTIVANLLLALGVTLAAVKFTQPALRNLIAPAFAALPPAIAQVMAYVRFDVAVSIVVSAVVFKAGKGIVKGFMVKGAQGGS